MIMDCGRRLTYVPQDPQPRIPLAKVAGVVKDILREANGKTLVVANGKGYRLMLNFDYAAYVDQLLDPNTKYVIGYGPPQGGKTVVQSVAWLVALLCGRPFVHVLCANINNTVELAAKMEMHMRVFLDTNAAQARRHIAAAPDPVYRWRCDYALDLDLDRSIFVTQSFHSTFQVLPNRFSTVQSENSSRLAL